MKILFIDDEINVLKSINRSLNKWFKERKIDVYMTGSSHDALLYVKKFGSEIGVIVSDQQMPDLKGSQLISLINKKHPDIISIILSGHSDMSDMESIIKTDIFTFLKKPWNTNQLKMEIEKAINLFNMKIENRQLKSRINKELALAGEFQNKILSSTLNQSLPISINVTYKPSPSSGVSGDYYEIIKISNSEIVVLSGDVSGHGIKPAFITMALKSIISYEYFNNLKDKTFRPMDFTTWLNSRLNEYLKGFTDIFLTFTTIYIDIKNSLCSITNAGQPNPVIIEGESIRDVINKNMVLGVDKQTQFDQTTFPFTEHTRLFLCSDGIHPVGCENKNYSEDDFKSTLYGYKDKLWDHESILEDIQTKFIKKPWDDDITVIDISLERQSL